MKALCLAGLLALVAIGCSSDNARHAGGYPDCSGKFGCNNNKRAVCSADDGSKACKWQAAFQACNGDDAAVLLGATC